VFVLVASHHSEDAVCVTFPCALLDTIVVWHNPAFFSISSPDFLTGVTALILMRICAIAAATVAFWQGFLFRMQMVRNLFFCANLVLFFRTDWLTSGIQALPTQIVIYLGLNVA
jgi:hypothetical protein